MYFGNHIHIKILINISKTKMNNYKKHFNYYIKLLFIIEQLIKIQNF